MVTTVSAEDNITVNENNPIEYKELEVDGYDSEYMVIGAYVEYPMRTFTESEIAKEVYVHGPINTNENDTRTTPYFKNSIVNRTFDGNATIIIAGNNNITGLIYFSFLKTPLNLTDGKVQYDITGLENGHYSFNYYYSGNEEYKDGIDTINFTIPSISSPIITEKDKLEMYYKDGTEFRVFLKNQWGTLLKNRNIYFEINGVRYKRTTNENGSASIKLNLNPGDYDIITLYHGSLSTAGNLTHTKITVLPTILGENITKIFKNGTQYNVKLTDNKGNILINQSVIFNINGVYYNRTTNENGSAKLNINLPQGTYIITAENLNTTDKISNTIEVLPTIISNDLIKIYKNNSQFNIKALKTDQTPLTNTNITFNINGVFYNRTTDNNGNTKLNINLKPGTYIITTENPNDNCKVSNTIIVTGYLHTKDLTKYYKNESRFIAKLVDSNYNPRANEEIIFKINNVEYKRNTNNNGEASIAINLQPHEYEITTKTSEYETTNKIIILPTIIDLNENNVTINGDKKETYDVYVLDGNGNPFSNQNVTFNYADEKITVQTNNDGIASFDAIRINQYNPLKIEFNGYIIINDAVRFRMYPYIVADRTENGYIPIYNPSRIDSYIPSIIPYPI